MPLRSVRHSTLNHANGAQHSVEFVAPAGVLTPPASVPPQILKLQSDRALSLEMKVAGY